MRPSGPRIANLRHARRPRDERVSQGFALPSGSAGQERPGSLDDLREVVVGEGFAFTTAERREVRGPAALDHLPGHAREVTTELQAQGRREVADRFAEPRARLLGRAVQEAFRRRPLRNVRCLRSRFVKRLSSPEGIGRFRPRRDCPAGLRHCNFNHLKAISIPAPTPIIATAWRRPDGSSQRPSHDVCLGEQDYWPQKSIVPNQLGVLRFPLLLECWCLRLRARDCAQ